jgi:hypothetical protein
MAFGQMAPVLLSAGRTAVAAPDLANIAGTTDSDHTAGGLQNAVVRLLAPAQGDSLDPSPLRDKRILMVDDQECILARLSQLEPDKKYFHWIDISNSLKLSDSFFQN